MPAVAGTAISAAPATATAVLILLVMGSPERGRQAGSGAVDAPGAARGTSTPKVGARRVPWRAVTGRGRHGAQPRRRAPLLWGWRIAARRRSRARGRPRRGTAGPHRRLRQLRRPVLRPARLRRLGGLRDRQA